MGRKRKEYKTYYVNKKNELVSVYHCSDGTEIEANLGDVDDISKGFVSAQKTLFKIGEHMDKKLFVSTKRINEIMKEYWFKEN